MQMKDSRSLSPANASHERCLSRPHHRLFRETQSQSGSVPGDSSADATEKTHPNVSPDSRSVSYFGLVRMVPFGSSKSLCVPAGADKRNEDSAPSANTRPTSTGALPGTTA